MATMMWRDTDIQQDVIDEEVDYGVVTLIGTVDSYTVMLAAEEAVQRVAGVGAVVNNLSVRGMFTHNDTDIAKAAAAALEANFAVPADRVEVTVQNGKVMLRGEVAWAQQRKAAANTVRYLPGVRDVINLIQVRFRPPR
jgi:osmotically-inducible protein OsmY